MATTSSCSDSWKRRKLRRDPIYWGRNGQWLNSRTATGLPRKDRAVRHAARAARAKGSDQ